MSEPKKVLLTGDRPTGPLHLGHYVGSLQNRIQLQHTCEQFVMIADMQALTDYFERPEYVVKNVAEVVKDYLAVGIDPQKTTIFIQSQIPELCELTMLLLNLVTTSRLQRNPTIKNEIQLRGFEESIPAGFLCYPVSQAADITLFRATHVPAGEDQAPMIEQTNELVRRFNYTYKTDCLREVELMLSKTPRLIGIDGNAKASKSLGNAIFLSDSAETVHEKVFSMYTDPNHIRVSDPGKTEGNVVFAYLDAFDPDKDEVESLKAQYRKGGLGDMTLKRRLDEILQTLLKPVREKRAAVTDKEALEIAIEGTKKMKTRAKETMEAVRSAVGIVYRAG